MDGIGAMVIAQIITVAVAALAIVWNQQRTVAALRSEMRQEIAALRSEMAANSERRSRIEGYLGIGMTAEAAARAAGAGLITTPAPPAAGTTA